MPIQSMTGFGKAQAEGENYSLSVEIKTVNNRFKDVRFKMGSVFNDLEIPLKKIIEKNFKRGSFDIYINYKKNQTNKTNNELDFDKIKDFVNSMKGVANDTGVDMKFAPTDFLKSDFYLEDESKEEELKGLLLGSFDEAVENLKQSRVDEGSKLIEKLQKHRDEYLKNYEKIKPLSGTYQDQVKEKLLKKFNSEKNEIKIEESRFMQEVIYYLEKLDIDEEINRISIHLEKLNSLMQAQGEVGRQIDFLVQELNRETNTIGSKAGHTEISECVVQMKVQLEKIREQGLNLE